MAASLVRVLGLLWRVGVATANPFQRRNRLAFERGFSIVVAKAACPKQSDDGDDVKERLLCGVYPERSPRARNDSKENWKTLLLSDAD